MTAAQRNSFSGQMSLAVPEGWTGSHVLFLNAPDGTGVTLNGLPADDSATLTEFAERHGEQLAAELIDFSAGDLEADRLFGGRPALVRRASHDLGGRRRDLLLAYVVDHDLACVAIADLAGSGAARTVMELLRTGTLPGVTADEILDLTGAAPAPARAAADSEDWADARAVWERREGADEDQPETVRFTAEELFAVAGTLGGTEFTGVSGALLSGLGPSERVAVLRASARSLIVRGLAELSGTSVVSSEAGRWLSPGVHNDLVATIEVERMSGTTTTHLAARPDAGIAVSSARFLDQTFLDVAPLSAAMFAVAILRAAEMGLSTPSTADVVRTSPAALQRSWLDMRSTGAVSGALAAVLDGVTHVSRVRTLWRDHGSLAGGEMTLVNGATTCWLVEPTDSADELLLNPADPDKIHARLMQLLPGANEGEAR